jgi:hypothetical protein
MQMVPFQIDSCKDGAGNTVPGAADGARQYGEGLGCEEIARKYRSKTGVLHSYLNTDGTLLGGIESRTFAGKPTEKIMPSISEEGTS